MTKAAGEATRQLIGWGTAGVFHVTDAPECHADMLHEGERISAIAALAAASEE
jgi:hypothetical protein